MMMPLKLTLITYYQADVENNLKLFIKKHKKFLKLTTVLN